MSDQRDKSRVPIVLRIKLRYNDKGAFIDKFATNVSRGGMFISTRKPKEVGTELTFDLRLADSSSVIKGSGIVRWTRSFNPDAPREVHGMGIEFTDLADESAEVIEEIVEYRRSLGLDDGYSIPRSPEPAPEPIAAQEQAPATDDVMPTLRDVPRPSVPEVIAETPTRPVDVARAIERARELAYAGEGDDCDDMLALLLRGEPALPIDLNTAVAVVSAPGADLSSRLEKWDAALAELK